ncbi:hypothetical protein THASP1DRAFT_33419 [Thamnocephalis sphaerospora]|uniref:F-box domain-containing protein n=1 Tax=Thamnocephalis sphaerospora TaxID=78915 RepID=A0A4P9XGL2_9FUNG|nr:hypothetical protein THASP1DRAFT_33419 [Thamnocephalis sphaerospora]|eukprot:RKP04776.1 hypothetical protein THASP1DRAFT_33419 [Thamnocephalis sphaerospora]
MKPTTTTHTSLERVLHALPPTDRYRLFTCAGFHAALAIAGTCRSLGKLLTDNALWQVIYQHDFMPTMQACEAHFLDWCARTATRLADAEGDTSLAPCWAMLDWRDTYRRRVCTERNWKQGRYIRRVYAFPQLPGYRLHGGHADRWICYTWVHTSAATMHFTSRDGEDKPIVEHTYALDGDCVPNTEQERSELQRGFDAQPPASLDLVYFNDEQILDGNESELFDELQAQLQQHRGQHPHLDRLYDTVYNALGPIAGYHFCYFFTALRDCWAVLVESNGHNASDIVVCNMVYGTIQREPLDLVSGTGMTVIQASPKSIVIYMASLNEETGNLHWRLLEFTTNRPTKIMRSGVVRLALEAGCKIDYTLPIIEHGSERVDRVGVRIDRVFVHPPHMYELIVHDISATSTTDTPALPLLRKQAQILALVRLPGGFAFVKDSQLVCSVDEQTHYTEVDGIECLYMEPLLGYIFSVRERIDQTERRLLFNGQDGTRLPFSLENCSTPHTGIRCAQALDHQLAAAMVF